MIEKLDHNHKNNEKIYLFDHFKKLLLITNCDHKKSRGPWSDLNYSKSLIPWIYGTIKTGILEAGLDGFKRIMYHVSLPFLPSEKKAAFKTSSCLYHQGELLKKYEYIVPLHHLSAFPLKMQQKYLLLFFFFLGVKQDHAVKKFIFNDQGVNHNEYNWSKAMKYYYG